MNYKVKILFLTLIITQQYIMPSEQPNNEDERPSSPHLEWVKEILGFAKPKEKKLKPKPFDSTKNLVLKSDVFEKSDEQTRELCADIAFDKPIFQKIHRYSYKDHKEFPRDCKLANGWSPVHVAITMNNIPAAEALLQEGFPATEEDFHTAEFLIRDPKTCKISTKHKQFLASLYDHVQEKTPYFIQSQRERIDHFRRGGNGSSSQKPEAQWSLEEKFIKAAQTGDTVTMRTLVEHNKVNPNATFNSMDAISVATAQFQPEAVKEAIALKAKYTPQVKLTTEHLESALLRKALLCSANKDEYDTNIRPLFKEHDQKISQIIDTISEHVPITQINQETKSTLAFLYAPYERIFGKRK